MLGQRRRRRANINTTLGRGLVFLKAAEVNRVAYCELCVRSRPSYQ